METARVLDVGQCGADHAAVRNLIGAHFAAQVDRAASSEEAYAAAATRRYDLILVNRILVADRSEGIELIRSLKNSAAGEGVPVMLISDLDEAQRAARERGAEPGFGKTALDEPEVRARLAAYLPAR